MTSERGRVIRASEIGLYVYCARAWWLNVVQGYASANVAELAAGREAHTRHGRAVMGYHRGRQIATSLLGAALLVGAAWICALSQGGR